MGRRLSKEEFGRFMTPERIWKLEFKKELSSLFEKLYFNNLNYLMIANIFILSQLTALILYIVSYSYLYSVFATYIDQGGLYKYLVLFFTWFAYSLIFYYVFLLMYYFIHDSRHKKAQDQIEKDLPEFIDNLVSNLKGGISLEKALLKSVRKEQIALLREISLVNEKILMGETALEALHEFRERFKSPILERTIFLIEEGIKGGGNLAQPLERIADNLKKIYALNEEIKGSASGFAIVIQAISIIVAPLLFALAITLLTFIGNLFGLLAESGTDFLSVKELPPEFSQYLIIFSYAMIGIITLFSSMITSQLKNEKVYEAIKYLPIYIVISLILYNTFSSVLLGFFGSILG